VCNKQKNKGKFLINLHIKSENETRYECGIERNWTKCALNGSLKFVRLNSLFCENDCTVNNRLFCNSGWVWSTICKYRSFNSFL